MKTDVSHLIPNFRQPRPQLITGGQPEANAWKPLAEAGIKTVINLRPENELPGRNEAQEVKDANLTYINLPVEGPASLNKALTDQLWQVLNGAEGGVLVHCGTGNRCGAMLALTEAWFRQHNTEDAIAFGKQAGLTGMEPVVRDLLGK
jgi:uncharacterized protein (TIGR01244 family)